MTEMTEKPKRANVIIYCPEEVLVIEDLSIDQITDFSSNGVPRLTVRDVDDSWTNYVGMPFQIRYVCGGKHDRT